MICPNCSKEVNRIFECHSCNKKVCSFCAKKYVTVKCCRKECYEELLHSFIEEGVLFPDFHKIKIAKNFKELENRMKPENLKKAKECALKMLEEIEKERKEETDREAKENTID
jgi:hypothetical protein